MLVLLFFINYATFLLRDLINAIKSGEDILVPLTKIVVISALPLLLEPLIFVPKSIIHSRVVADLMNDLYKKIMSLDFKYHTAKETGSLLSKVINSDISVKLFLYQVEYTILDNLSAFLVPLIIIFFLSYQLGIIIVAVLLISFPLLYKLVNFNTSRRKVMKDAEYLRNSALVDGISSFETVRLFGRKDQDVSMVEEVVDKVLSAMLKYLVTFRWIDFLSRFAGVFMILVSSVYLYKNQSLFDIGTAAVIVTYVMQISNKLMTFVYSTRDAMNQMPFAEDVIDLLDLVPELKEPEAPIAIENPKGEIEFDHIAFAYGNKKQVIEDISLKILPGEVVAFVGPSGGGKTTLTRLLMRYYDPLQGIVKIDGVDEKLIGTEGVNKLIGAVPQDPILFNRSILYNIGYAISSSEIELKERFEDIILAAKRAQIHDFIMSLPDGYDTKVGERGVKLSGGQKQRIAIARVLLKQPKIVIFDEATSMLDSESESLIQKAFYELTKGTTTIVVAHRLSTIKNVDRIYVVDNGAIIEIGTHEELIKHGGVYSNLWTLQSSGFKID
jgi:ABC-type multidrug transport system fused ATPase/permease subunit